MDIVLYTEPEHLEAIRYFILTGSYSKIDDTNAKIYLYQPPNQKLLSMIVSYDEYVMMDDEGLIRKVNVL